LDRQARPIRPTPEGDKLYQAAQDLLAQSSHIVAEIREGNSLISHRLSIADVDSLTGILMPKLVERMNDKVGRWEFFAGLTPVCEHAFSTGKSELAIVAEDQAMSQLYIDPHLHLKEPFLKVFPRDYDQDANNLREVRANLRLVQFSFDSTAGRSVEQHVNRPRLQLPSSFCRRLAAAAVRTVSMGQQSDRGPRIHLFHTKLGVGDQRCMRTISATHVSATMPEGFSQSEQVIRRVNLGH